ncbi:MAG: ABC transporter permease, partial [Rhodospirillales bacterium]
MFSRFEWMMASRYLRPRRQDGFVSVIAMFSLLGIALGVATLIIVMSVMNGFREELMKRILGLNGHLSLYANSVSLTDYDAVTVRVAEVPGVVLVAPVVEGQVMATANTVARGALVRGMRPEDLRRRAIIAENIVAGSLDAFAGDNAVVVGSRLAERMGLAVGDDITLISPQGNVTVFGTVPTVRNYKVVATFNIGMFEYDSSFVFMPLEAAQTYFRMPGA